MKKEHASTKSVQEFRDAVVASLGVGSAVLLNTIDALAAGPRPNSPVELTLSALFAYDWSSLYQALRRAEDQLAETIEADDWLRKPEEDGNAAIVKAAPELRQHFCLFFLGRPRQGYPAVGVA